MRELVYKDGLKFAFSLPSRQEMTDPRVDGLKFALSSMPSHQVMTDLRADGLKFALTSLPSQ